MKVLGLRGPHDRVGDIVYFGWNDSVSVGLEKSNSACGFGDRKEIVTFSAV